MSWHIAATGTVAAVRHHVETATVNDQAQGEATKRLIADVLETVPTNGVRVRAGGHQDSGRCNMHIEVEGVDLVLDEPVDGLRM